MADETTTVRIEQQRELATAVAEIAALRREHTTAMASVNSTCSEIKDALREIFAWHREMEKRHNEATWHCSAQKARTDGHDARFVEQDGRIRTLEQRRDESSDELAAAVVQRMAEGSGGGGVKGLISNPSVLWPIMILLAILAIIGALTGRDVKTLTPTLPLPAGDK